MNNPRRKTMDITTKAMLVSLTIKAWSGAKIDKRVGQDVAAREGADNDAGHYSKKLVAKDALADIKAISSKARAKHYEYTLPWSQDGGRILPSAVYAKHAAEMRQHEDDFELAVKAFMADYKGQILLAQRRLGSMFVEADYPDPQDIESKFAWEINVMPIPSGNDFRVSLSQDMTNAIRQDIEAKTGKAVQDATRSLFERVSKTISHMAESLEEYGEVIENGKVKKINPFRDSVVGNIQELVELLPVLNITGDSALTNITENIKKSLLNASAKDLREDPALRREVAKDARKVLEDMEGYI
jgi:hypothetical protein